jgi:hypothetical protein
MTINNKGSLKPGCSICSKLANKEYAMQKFGSEYSTSLPAAVNQLVLIVDLKPNDYREKKLKQCKECGAYYLYETDYEYLVNGTEDEEIITRLSPEEADEYLAVLKP